jgi:polyisoprenoid-binding protein YceI
VLAARVALACLAAAWLPSAVAAVPDGAAPPGAIRFRGRVSLGPVDGEFVRWRVTRAVIDDQDPARTEVDVEIDVGSLDTDNRVRDRHLRSDDFFAVEQFPTATARLREVRPDGDGFTARIELDLRGVTRTFPMRFAIADRAKRRVAGSVTLRRTDFGVGSERGGLIRVDDEVEVEVDVVVPAADPSAGAAGAGVGDPG